MGQPVVHFELWSKEPAKVSEFYTKVFGWNITPMAGFNYNIVQTGGQGGINGGIMTPEKGPWPGNMSFYIDVEDLAAFREKIKQAGGKILVEYVEVPDKGAFSLFEDPDGRCMGLWLQKKK